MEDLLSTSPYFMVQQTFFVSSCVDRCKPFDLWIPEAVEDLLSSFPYFMVYHSNTLSFPSRHHHIKILSDR
jgi:hypothetical protein